MKRDTRGVNYAETHNVKQVYVDTDTGDIMQFGTSKSKIEFKKKCDGMFPERKCKVYSLTEYLKITENAKQDSI